MERESAWGVDFVGILIGCVLSLLGGAQRSYATEMEWQLVGLAGSAIRTLAIDPQTPTILYAAPAQGILRSIDGGDTWQETGYSGEARTLLIDPLTPAMLYALDEQGFVAKSIDSAASWMDANTGLPQPVIGLALDAFEPSTLWAADYYFVRRSTNAAETWNEFARPPHGITAFAPSQSRSGVFLGLYRDGPGFVGTGAANEVTGETLAGIASGGDCSVDAAQSPIYSVATDPVRPNIFYAGYASGICKTTDNGSNWRFLPSSVGTGIDFIDPFHPDTLYVFGEHLLRSTDGGETFDTFEPGLPSEVVVIDLAVDADGRLYAATNSGVYALGTSEATPTPSPTTTPAGCAGDCDNDGSVAIGELVRMVSIVIDEAALASCRAGDHDHDGDAEINDLLAAVGSALHGCSSRGPSPTPTPDPAESEAGFCYESAACFPCDVYPCAPFATNRAFCCRIWNGSFSWCPADEFDPSTNSCGQCASPCP